MELMHDALLSRASVCPLQPRPSVPGTLDPLGVSPRTPMRPSTRVRSSCEACLPFGRSDAMQTAGPPLMSCYSSEAHVTRPSTGRVHAPGTCGGRNRPPAAADELGSGPDRVEQLFAASVRRTGRVQGAEGARSGETPGRGRARRDALHASAPGRTVRSPSNLTCGIRGSLNVRLWEQSDPEKRPRIHLVVAKRVQLMSPSEPSRQYEIAFRCLVRDVRGRRRTRSEPDRVRSLRPPPRFTKSDARNQLT